MKPIFFFLCLTSCLSGIAQRRLELVKRNTVVSRFEEGEYIRFQRKGQDYFTNGMITGIGRDFFKMGEEDTIYVYNIRKIDLRHHSHTNFKTAESGSKLIVAGALLLLINALNPANGNSTDYGLVVVSCSLIGVGIFMQFVNNNYFKTGPKRKVIVRD